MAPAHTMLCLSQKPSTKDGIILPAILFLAWVHCRAKGTERVVVTSDIAKFGGLPPGDYEWLGLSQPQRETPAVTALVTRSACMCVCAWARARVRACVCACVRARVCVRVHVRTTAEPLSWARVSTVSSDRCVPVFSIFRFVAWGGQPFEWSLGDQDAKLETVLQRCEELSPACHPALALTASLTSFRFIL